MILRAAFIADGSSDLPIAGHLAALCLERGAAAVVTPVDRSLLGASGSTVKGRLAYLVDQSPGLDPIFVHRDAEAQSPDQRRREIADAASDLGAPVPVVPVVPVRMTEAWLLLDEAAIRSVADKPRGKAKLTMPKASEVESLPDPKDLLKRLLLEASETRGRRAANSNGPSVDTVPCSSSISIGPARCADSPPGGSWKPISTGPWGKPTSCRPAGRDPGSGRSRHLQHNGLPPMSDLSRLRSLCIVAHVDHGKSTLADRILQLTGAVDARDMRAQFLDSMDIERERGITIKAQNVRVQWKDHLIQFVDTPGHVDFGYEVSRSLAACEGVVLVVDAAQGIEAQTLANCYLALENDLAIVACLNKIDLPAADPERYAAEIETVLGIPATEIYTILFVGSVRCV